MIFAIFALAASAAALLLLWANWRDGRSGWPRGIGVIALLAIATTSWIESAGAEVGIPLLLETSALLAFGFILTRIERRAERIPRARTVAAPVRTGGRWPGVLRFVVAGPLGLTGALGIAVLIATRAPSAEQTRLILGALLVPSLWATMIGWVVAHHRLPVQTATFVVLGGAGFGMALIGAGR